MASVLIRGVRPTDARVLGDFFETLSLDPSAHMFHPHPLTAEYAGALVAGDRMDEYFIAVDQDRVIGYGMLRGWDEGYTTPAFGVAVLSEARGRGVGRQLLRYAFELAREHDATEVMLKVHPDNRAAKLLYESEGFEFTGVAEDGIQLKGTRKL